VDHRRSLGLEGENTALEYLLCKGYELLARNYRCRLGEMDLVMRDQGRVIFVEVRTKSTLSYGTGLESITYRKRTKLRRVAEQFLARYSLQGADLRFDVVSILHPRGGQPTVDHVEGAF